MKLKYTTSQKIMELITTVIILAKMEITIVFSYITYCDIKIQPLGIWLLPVFLIILFSTMLYYILKICKNSRANN